MAAPQRMRAVRAGVALDEDDAEGEPGVEAADGEEGDEAEEEGDDDAEEEWLRCEV